jgi:hypothetical protein
MSWNDIAMLVGALGGIELIKFFANRTTDKKINQVHAQDTEFASLKTENEALLKMLDDWIKRYDDQTHRLRLTQDALMQERQHCAEKDLRISYLTFWRCEYAECATRRPPGRMLHGMTFDAGAEIEHTATSGVPETTTINKDNDEDTHR